MTLISTSEWDEILSGFPDAHILQTGAWGELKSAYGWESIHIVSEDPKNVTMGAQVLFRRLPFGYRLGYVPKGPLFKTGMAVQSTDWDNLWPEIDKISKLKKAAFLKVEPDLWEPLPLTHMEESTTRPVAPIYISQDDQGDLHPASSPKGFLSSHTNIQPRRSLLVSLRGGEERILGRMKQKTRYNIRLALKKGVVVRTWTDLHRFYQLIQETGGRDQFAVHSLDYYQRAYELFHARGLCELFVAELDGNPLAALMVFARGKRAWYFYGASSNEHREFMPTYLLQWEAMRWAATIGCVEYDLWGVPDEDESVLESNFMNRTDALWGVYRFKRGFGGRLVRSVGSWDRVYNPLLYRFYRWWSIRAGA